MEPIGDTLKKQKHPGPLGKASEDLLPEEDEEVCPACKGAGFVHPLKDDGKPDYSRVVPCRACRTDEVLAREKHDIYLKHCQLPEGTESMTFKTFVVDDVTREAYEAAQDLANEKGLKWLTLLGTVDQGKTHLAIAICRHWLERGKAARYAYVPLMLDELREGFEKGGDASYQALFRFFCQVPLLVLDDLGTEKPTGFAKEKLNAIIDFRYIYSLPLVVTLNRRLDEIPGDEEHRIASRLQRFNHGKVIALEGMEYRLRKGKK